MNQTDNLGWTPLTPPPGGLARMRARLVAPMPATWFWLEFVGACGFSLALVLSVAAPLATRWQQRERTQAAVAQALSQPTVAVRVQNGAALERPLAVPDTRLFLIALRE